MLCGSDFVVAAVKQFRVVKVTLSTFFTSIGERGNFVEDCELQENAAQERIVCS